MWVGFKVFFHLNELPYDKSKKNRGHFVPKHPGIYGN
jgi:hypothetical protein